MQTSLFSLKLILLFASEIWNVSDFAFILLVIIINSVRNGLFGADVVRGGGVSHFPQAQVTQL